MPGEQFLITDGELVDDIEPSEEQVEFDKFRDEMGDAEKFAKMSVFRQPQTSDGRPGQKKLVFLFDCGLDQFDYSQLLSYVRDGYGGGLYRIQGRDSNGKLIFNRSFEIEVPKTGPLPSSGIGGGSETASELINTVQTMIENSQRQTMEMMQRFLPAKNATPQDPMAMFGTMMGLMIQMKDFFGGAQAQPVSLLKEIEKHKAIADLFGGGGETNESDIWVTLAKQFAPAIVEGMTAGQANPALAAPVIDAVSGAPALGAAVVATAPGAGVAEPGPKKESAEMLYLKTQAGALFSAAKNGVAPEKMADTILNLTPATRFDDLYAFMNSESCVQTFVDACPPLEAYRDWLAKVQVNILGELVQDDFKEPLPGTSPDAEETLHPGELTGTDESFKVDTDTGGGHLVVKELTDTENEDKIEKSEKVKPKPKAKVKAGKKSAAKSSEKDH